MARVKIPYKTSCVVELIAPTDVVSNEPLSNADDGSTCSFEVFDPEKDESLTSAAITGATTLYVSNAGVFVINDIVDVALTDGNRHLAYVTGVSGSAGTITINPGLASGASLGARVRVRLGNPVSMSDFGTPELEKRDWGFRGTLLSTHPGLKLDKQIDIEINFIGDPGNPGTLNLLDVINGIIKPNHECNT